MQLIFATNNQHKVLEMQAAVGDAFKLTSLRAAGINIDIPEPHDTLEANASEKSWTIFNQFGYHCFSEDTGLETVALNGEPGVRSARYAGDDSSAEKNINKLLERMEDLKERSARFRTVISLIIDGREYLFEGICAGRISEERRGEQGFGYDAIFIPEGGEKSFGEMTLAEKERYSHRKKAADKLVAFLRGLPSTSRP